MFRNRFSRKPVSAEPLPTQKLTLVQAKRLADIIINFDQHVQSLPEDNPTRIRIEASQEDLRRARRSGEQVLHKLTGPY